MKRQKLPALGERRGQISGRKSGAVPWVRERRMVIDKTQSLSSITRNPSVKQSLTPSLENKGRSFSGRSVLSIKIKFVTLDNSAGTRSWFRVSRMPAWDLWGIQLPLHHWFIKSLNPWNWHGALLVGNDNMTGIKYWVLGIKKASIFVILCSIFKREAFRAL